jgi:hypothetical protein
VPQDDSRGRRRLAEAAAQARGAASRVFFERGLAASTQTALRLEDLGLAAPGRTGYEPSGWLWLRRALRGCRITREDVFVDFGSGLGRVVYAAARHHPFGRVIGVELSERYNEVARRNIEHARRRLRCPDVEIVTADATQWLVPDEMTYAYLFNPFKGEVFAAVLDNILASLDRRPRRLTILYANPVMGRAILDTGRFRRVRSSHPRQLGRARDDGRIDVFASIS